MKKYTKEEIFKKIDELKQKAEKREIPKIVRTIWTALAPLGRNSELGKEKRVIPRVEFDRLENLLVLLRSGLLSGIRLGPTASWRSCPARASS